jgi:FkbM family methyltransferase
MTDHGLIIDVGMHRGFDTEFYLAKGFRVVAIEASPEMVADASQRLAEHLESGRLEILHVAVAEEPGDEDFYISEREGWGSARQDWAESRAAMGVGSRVVTVRADTMASILAGRETAHYVKIDIEGADMVCLRGLADVEKPAFLSVECDPVERAETVEMVRLLGEYGYRRFKLVNQALNPSVRCPDPAREGDYVDARFGHYSSGPFGEESPGEWVTADEVLDRYARVARGQAIRASYTASGRILGIPVGRVHRQLEWVYNAAAVRWTRSRWAAVRGTEVGGWFDLHAAL